MIHASSILFFLVLLAIAAVCKPFSDKLRLPYPVLLVVIGFIGSEVATRLLGLDTGIHWHNLKTIILYGLLPVLIFQSALRMEPGKLRDDFYLVFVLAVPLMLLSTIIIAVLVYLGINHNGFPWIAALVTGALLSATDPAAVITLLQRSGVSTRLSLLLQGESLFNDATAIVLFTLFVGIASVGNIESVPWTNASIRFLSVFLGGLAAGATLAILAGALMKITRGQNLHGLVSVVTVYGGFIIAENVLHLSGVMAVLAVGLVFGYMDRSSSDIFERQTVEAFWDVVAGTAEILIFLLAGISIIPAMFTDQWYAMLTGIIAVLAARGVVIYAGLPLAGFFSARQRLTVADRTIIYWGGVRGTVTLALALSIPLSLDYWYTIQSIAYGVVLFTLFVQATTMPPLIRKLEKF
ncbi:MAG TPA: sodium:proton antiporter [Gammaproteobacteria bacterium]|nr:sodium:proton antiporter [Gammaproteobacteria bacterium]